MSVSINPMPVVAGNFDVKAKFAEIEKSAQASGRSLTSVEIKDQISLSGKTQTQYAEVLNRIALARSDAKSWMSYDCTKYDLNPKNNEVAYRDSDKTVDAVFDTSQQPISFSYHANGGRQIYTLLQEDATHTFFRRGDSTGSSGLLYDKATQTGVLFQEG